MPLRGWQLGAVDRQGGLLAAVDQGVEFLDLWPVRWSEEPLVVDQQLDLGDGFEAALLVAGTFCERDAVEQFPSG